METGRYEDAARDTMRTVGRAVVTTSIVVAVGFAVLMTSAANAYRHVGLVTVVGVVAALLSDLLVTPTLLRITRAFGPEEGGRAS
jgi:predicted RND superfamily exporter protein